MELMCVCFINVFLPQNHSIYLYIWDDVKCNILYEYFLTINKRFFDSNSKLSISVCDRMRVQNMFFMHAKLNFVYLWVPKHNLEKDEVAYSKMGRERSFLNPFRRPMHVHDCWISMERSFFCTCTCNIYIRSSV